MIWRIWPKRKDRSATQPQRTKKRTEEDLRKAAVQPQAKRDRQPRNLKQVQRDPEVDPAKPTDN